MMEMAKIVGKLIAVLVFKGILTQTDKAFVLGNITEAEWIEESGWMTSACEDHEEKEASHEES